MDNKRYKIMLVDDNLANLTLGKNLLRTFYEVYTLPSAAQLFTMLGKVTPDIILLDIEMPEMDGYEAIRTLKEDSRTADIPVIFLSAKNDVRSELEGFNLGAVDYISKPFSAPLLLRRVETQLLLARQKMELIARQEELRQFNENLQELVRQKTAQVFQLQDAILGTMSDLLEFRDDKIAGHVKRTQRYLELLIKKLLDQHIYTEEAASWNMEYLLLSGQLHDVGKIAIKDDILNKPARLTPEEYEIIKLHTTYGVDVIEHIEYKACEHEFLHHAKIIAGTHHEKWDGTGYPLGLSGRNIPLEGRLMAVADVYDALVSSRPYKEPFSTERAQQIIHEGSGSHFDPTLVGIFQEVAPDFAEIAVSTDNFYQCK